MALIRRRPPKRLVYVQISADRILLRRVATGQTIDDIPRLAVDLAGQVIAVGRAADEAMQWRSDLRIVNGFSHPRCLIDDMGTATLTLTTFLNALLYPRGPRRFRRIRPDLVIHPAGLQDLSGLEAWGLHRIAEIAGARSVRVWIGEEPPYDSLLGGPPQGGSWRILPPPQKRMRRG